MIFFFVDRLIYFWIQANWRKCHHIYYIDIVAVEYAKCQYKQWYLFECCHFCLFVMSFTLLFHWKSCDIHEIRWYKKNIKKKNHSQKNEQRGTYERVHTIFLFMYRIMHPSKRWKRRQKEAKVTLIFLFRFK